MEFEKELRNARQKLRTAKQILHEARTTVNDALDYLESYDGNIYVCEHCTHNAMQYDNYYCIRFSKSKNPDIHIHCTSHNMYFYTRSDYFVIYTADGKMLYKFTDRVQARLFHTAYSNSIFLQYEVWYRTVRSKSGVVNDVEFAVRQKRIL